MFTHWSHYGQSKKKVHAVFKKKSLINFFYMITTPLQPLRAVKKPQKRQTENITITFCVYRQS